MASNLSIVETLAHLEKKIVYHREQHFAMAVALAVIAWLGYQAARGLRTGCIRVAGFRFSRAERPGEFWLILAVHVFVILLLLAVIALELTS